MPQAWLKIVSWTHDCASIPAKVITDTLEVLEKTGFIKASGRGGFTVDQFVNASVAKLV